MIEEKLGEHVSQNRRVSLPGQRRWSTVSSSAGNYPLDLTTLKSPSSFSNVVEVEARLKYIEM